MSYFMKMNPEKVEFSSPVTNNEIKYIPSQDLAKMLEEKNFFSKYILIDCRYPYEYNGGTLKNAINIHDPKELQDKFFEDRDSEIFNKIPIFFCEFSEKRGPFMARNLRSLDRQINCKNYPYIQYSKIFILQKGYKNFYETIPNEIFYTKYEYISMLNPTFNNLLKNYQNHRKGSNKCSLSLRSISNSENMLTCPSKEKNMKKFLASNIFNGGDDVFDSPLSTKPLLSIRNSKRKNF